MVEDAKNTGSLSPTAIVSAFPEELTAMMAQLGEPAYRGKQLFDWVQHRSTLDPALMTNLPKDFREKIRGWGLHWPVSCGAVLASSDGTRKVEVRLADGYSVETVLIPDGDRLTQCISSQVGCGVGCLFCRSGSEGLRRNLSAAEIVSQIHMAKRHYYPGEKLRNVVLMGVGEPLHNVDEVIRAISLMVHPAGLDLSSRRVTLSTVGYVRGLDRLGEALGGDVALAVSLHAGSEEVRRQLVPKGAGTLRDVVDALHRYPLPKRRRITIEYVLIRGINDNVQEARRLAKLLAPLKVKINLLPLNPHDRTEFQPPADETVLQFQEVLVNKGFNAIIRKRRGDDINAACGQLLSTQGAPLPTQS